MMGGKKITGRKRHIAVDTQGNLLAVRVTAASVDDAEAAVPLLACLPPTAFPRLTLLFADSKYHNHALYETLIEDGPSYELRTVHRPEGAQGFVVLPRRWVVERTLAWLVGFRRLDKDYEKGTWSSETRVRIAMLQLLLRRLHWRSWRHWEPPFKYRWAA